jgi:hypothetical protein
MGKHRAEKIPSYGAVRQRLKIPEAENPEAENPEAENLRQTNIPASPLTGLFFAQSVID